MYTRIIRPLLFAIEPERVHHLVVGLMKFFFGFNPIRKTVRNCYRVDHPVLRRRVFGLDFDNPVGIAAGFDKNAEVFGALSAFGFSHVEIGTVVPLPQPGNPKPRLFRLRRDKGLINRMGFNHKGLEYVKKQLANRPPGLIVGGNIGKNTLTPNEQAAQDYLTCFEGLFDLVDYFVVNVSCPNITNMKALQDQEALLGILNTIQQNNNARPKRKPVLLKVSPDLNEQQLDEVISIVKQTGIDGVVATNTTITRHTITHDKETAMRAGNGGLSGLPLQKRSTEVIRYLAEKSGKAFPIIGVGGIMNAADALEKLEAGADLVQVYTGFIYSGPSIARKINKALLKRQSD
ncbi:MAG: quinone-dependent dihydroorotate dehydrogenase [Bacteroidetes bacterium]|nr:quinone-dependent dihydroorotate dehydrogenase [Bacteroidota bacterium]